MCKTLLKNTYAAIVALFIAMYALPQQAQAQAEYDLLICGTWVTSDNCNDLSVIDGVEGTVKYDPNTKILTLKDAKLNAGGNTCIRSQIDGLTIEVSGTNELNATRSAIYFYSAPATITGGGTLNVKSQTNCGIYVNETNLTIKDCIVNAKGRWGITGSDVPEENLLIKNATVTAEGKDGSICDFKEITLEGCAITQPVGAEFDESMKAVVLNGEVVTSEVKIEPATKYDLFICGTQVTSDHCGDLSKISGVEGTVKYDPNTQTLTLKDAELFPGRNGNCIWSGIDGLTIKVSGTNRLTAIESSAIIVNAPTTITGDGTLHAYSREGCGIYAKETDLTIKDCTVSASGKWGITGYYNVSAKKLLIKNATVIAEGTYGSICDFKEITLEGCTITQPAGAVNSQGAIRLNGEIVKSVVRIELTRYDLWICGTRVTAANYKDLSVIDGVKGTVKYDPDSKTLTLKDATLYAKKRYGIGSGIDGLTVKVIGTNEVNVIDNLGICFTDAPATITGGGTLNVKSQETGGIYVFRTDLTIINCTVNTKGSWGIAGYMRTEKLHIKNATVRAEGMRHGSIWAFASLTLEGCAITQPAGAKFDASLKGIVLNGEIVKSEVKIEPVTEYKLWIAGTQVTSANCDDLSVIDGVEGTVKYDPNTKILTLKDAKLNAEYNILSKIDGLTIKVSGTNEVNATGAAICFYSAPATITGGGTLNVKGQESCGIYVQKTNLTIKDCIVNAKGRWGIIGSSGSEEKLLIKNATVRAEGKGVSICNFKEITLEDCAITQPAGAVFDESKHAVVLNGEVVTSKVVIEPVTEYKLFIRDTRVTSANCNDLSVIDGVEGTVKYDPNTNILTLKDAIVNTKEGYACIYSWTDGLTIEVSGTNELNGERGTGIYINAPTTITGGGTINANNYKVCVILVDGTNLTINNCIVNAKGKYGIAGFDGTKEKLLIKNATVRAEGEEGSICDFKEVTLEGCAITQPAGAKFDADQHAIVLNGEKVTSKIVITRDPAGIEAPTIGTATKQGIYTLSGVKLNGEVKDLPKGIYVVNGKKVVK